VRYLLSLAAIMCFAVAVLRAQDPVNVAPSNARSSLKTSRSEFCGGKRARVRRPQCMITPPW